MSFLIIFEAIVIFVAGGFVVYTLLKQRQLEKEIEELRDLVYGFPSPEDLAKEIIKIKIPLSELPKDQVERLKQMGGQSPMMPSFEDLQSPQPSSGSSKKINKPSYVG